MSLRTACLSLVAMVVITMVLVTIIFDGNDGVERPEQRTRRKREETSSSANDAVKSKQEPRKDVVTIGSKEFKLYEKKKLNHKKAQSYCKKHEGKLAQAANMDEMRGLQVLMMTAKTLGSDIWIGADKKEWKQHSFKMQRKPAFGPDPAMFGGGPTEMCPALSFSTRSLFPLSCSTELPWICEYDLNKQQKMRTTTTTATRRPTPRRTTTVKPKSKRSINKGKKSRVEMRRKRELETFAESTTINAETTEVMESSSSSSDVSLVFDSEDINVDFASTESAVEKAAEHNIGFSPHVEQTVSNSNQLPQVVEPRMILQVKLSTKLVVDDKQMNSPSSTVDPDQFMVDLMDEQTVNLTAIELESSESNNVGKPVVGGQDPSTEKIVEKPQTLLEVSQPVSEVSKITRSTEDSSTSFAFEEFMDGNFYSNNSYEGEETTSKNSSTQTSQRYVQDDQNSTSAYQKYSYTESDPVPTEEARRQVRNVTNVFQEPTRSVTLFEAPTSNGTHTELSNSSRSGVIQVSLSSTEVVSDTEVTSDTSEFFSSTALPEDLRQFHDKPEDLQEMQSVIAGTSETSLPNSTQTPTKINLGSDTYSGNNDV